MQKSIGVAMCAVVVLFMLAGPALAELPFHDAFAPDGEPSLLWAPSTETTLTILIAPEWFPVPVGCDGAVANFLTSWIGPLTRGDVIAGSTSQDYYAIEVQIFVKGSTTDTTEGIGLLFHGGPLAGGTFTIETSPAERAHFEIYSGSVRYEKNWSMASSSPQYIPPGTWHKLTIEFSGAKNAQIRVDDQPWDSLSWTEETGGAGGSFGITHYYSGPTLLGDVIDYVDEFRAQAVGSSVSNWSAY
jgi:hypothetical protein